MARELDQDELIERWTLIGDDRERVASKRSAAKLGFAFSKMCSPKTSGPSY